MKRGRVEVIEHGLDMPCTCCDEQSLTSPSSRAFLAVSIVCVRNKQMQLMRLTGINLGPVLLLRVNTGHDFSVVMDEEINASESESDLNLKLTMSRRGLSAVINSRHTRAA